MTTQSSSWQKRLGARIDLMRRDDPQFAADYLVEKKAHRPPLLDRLVTGFARLIGVPLLLVWFPGMASLLLASLSDGDYELWIALVGYVLTIAMCLIAGRMIELLYHSEDLSVCSHLPVSDSDLVQRNWKRVFLVTLPVLWCLIAIDIGLFASSFSLPASIALAIGFALLQWGFVVGAGTWLASTLPMWPHSRNGFVMILFGIISIPYVRYFGAEAAQSLAWVGLLAPGGWVGDALWFGTLLGNPVMYLAALPALLVTLCLPLILKQFQRRVCIREFVIQGQDVYSLFAGSFTGQEVNLSAPLGDSDDGEAFEVPEETVREYWRHLDKSFDWTIRGWQERFIAKWLTPRERQLVTFLTGDVTNWSSLWNLLFMVIVIGSATIAAAGMTFHEIEAFFEVLWIVPLAAAVFVTQDSFPGMYTTKCSGSFVSHFANYPLGTGELSRVVLKLAFFKSCFLCLMFAPFIGLMMFRSPHQALSLTACLFTGVMCLSFWRLGFLLSCGYAMPRFKLRNLWVPLVLIELFTVTVTAAVFSVISSINRLPWLLPQLAACWVSSITIWWIFKRQVDRSRVDLVTTQNPFGELPESLESSQRRVEASYWKRKCQMQEYGPFWKLRRMFG